MAVTYYIDDPNGTICSEDKSRRFSKLVGSEVHDYFVSGKGKGKRFMQINEEEYVELPPRAIKEYRTEERRIQYLNDVKEEHGIEIVSLDACIHGNEDGEELTLADLLVDESVNIEAETAKKEIVSRLYQALGLLTKEERQIIELLYLASEPRSEEEVGTIFGRTQQAISKQKNKILGKLKNFLKFF